jgi:hypothetical protein
VIFDSGLHVTIGGSSHKSGLRQTTSAFMWENIKSLGLPVTKDGRHTLKTGDWTFRLGEFFFGLCLSFDVAAEVLSVRPERSHCAVSSAMQPLLEIKI